MNFMLGIENIDATVNRCEKKYTKQYSQRQYIYIY